MVSALIFVDNKLAYSVALRYARRLVNTSGMDLKSIYIEKPEHGDRPRGTGWVKST